MATTDAEGGYRQRRPEDDVLHAVVRDHLEAFLADARARSPHGFGVRRHVERELRGYLRCGVLAHGFARVRCAGCGFERLLPFSCKGRAVCPSCRGRRRADTGAHLVDRVLPVAPYRQWTLSLPWRLRPRLAHDRRLLTRVLAAFTALVPAASAHADAARAPGPAGPHAHPRSHQHPAPPAPRPRQPSRLPWAELLRRVFREDLEVCPRCAGPVRVLAAITDPDAIAAILAHLGLPTAPPPTAPARAPPQPDLWADGLDPSPDLDRFAPA